METSGPGGYGNYSNQSITNLSSPHERSWKDIWWPWTEKWTKKIFFWLVQRVVARPLRPLARMAPAYCHSLQYIISELAVFYRHTCKDHKVKKTNSHGGNVEGEKIFQLHPFCNISVPIYHTHQNLYQTKTSVKVGLAFSASFLYNDLREKTVRASQLIVSVK